MYSKNSAVSKNISVELTSWGNVFGSQWTSVKILFGSVRFIFIKDTFWKSQSCPLIIFMRCQ